MTSNPQESMIEEANHDITAAAVDISDISVASDDIDRNSPIAFVTNNKLFAAGVTSAANPIAFKKKPRENWTKEKCMQVASQYQTRYEFAAANGGAYNKARHNKWLDEICAHMIQSSKPKGYWTKERCAEEALKYSSRSQYMLHSGSSYRAALSHSWLDEICRHMSHPNTAKQFQSSPQPVVAAMTLPVNVFLASPDYGSHNDDFACGESRTNSIDSYSLHSASSDNELTDHDDMEAVESLNLFKKRRLMSNMFQTRTYENFLQQKCWEKASMYQYRADFITDYPQINDFCVKKGWGDELLNHML